MRLRKSYSIKQKLVYIQQFRDEAPKSIRKFAKENGFAETNLRLWLKQEAQMKKEVEEGVIQVGRK